MTDVDAAAADKPEVRRGPVRTGVHVLARTATKAWDDSIFSESRSEERRVGKECLR